MAAGKFKAYSPGQSDTQKSIRVLSEPQTYGSATLSGYIYSDTVCLSYLNLKNKKPSPFGTDYDKCVKDFQFIAITSSKGLNDGIQGILGLGPFN